MLDLEAGKREICSIGDRLYKRGFASGNEGNITLRVDAERVLCTPTMHSKGFLKPEDICLIDMEGRQLAGERKRSSEALLHLAIMKARPDVQSVVHCHPPHVTAFAITREAIPQGLIPEVEVFIGEAPISPYETPGSQAFAETILPFVSRTNVVVLANHGAVSWGDTVEHAYWYTEILDSYCRMLILAKQIGRVQYLSPEKTRELIALKAVWGFDDPRTHGEAAKADPRSFPAFRDTWAAAGVRTGAFGDPATSDATSPADLRGLDEAQFERLVAEVTRRVLESLR
jgi:L-fuculose-phosphate aldolase